MGASPLDSWTIAFHTDAGDAGMFYSSNQRSTKSFTIAFN